MTTVEQLVQEPLPEGWSRMTIEKLALHCKIGDERVTEDLASKDGTIPLIVSGDINGTKEVRINKYVTLEALKEKARQVALKKTKGRKKEVERISPGEGTVLLNIVRKKAGSVSMLNTQEAVFNNAVYIITPDLAYLYPDWLFYYFKNPRIRHIINSEFMPAKATYASVKRIQKLAVPIPPKDQQEKLLRRIEGLLPDVERAEVLLKQNQMAIDLLLSSTLQEIFTPLRMTDWNHQSLTQLITIDDATPLSTQSSEYLHYHPIVANAIHSALAHTTIDRSGDLLTETSFSLLTNNQDAIIYAKQYGKNELHLRIAMPYKDINQDQRANIDGFKYGSDLYQLTVSDTKRVLPRFLFWSLLSPQLTRAIKGDSKGKLSLSKEKIYSNELFFPDLDEQEHISTYLDSVREKVIRMHASQVASMEAIEKMEESILTQAFAGKL